MAMFILANARSGPPGDCADLARSPGPSLFRRLWRFVFFACVLFPANSLAQAFLFASPNTREHMTDECAWNSLESVEQQNFLAVANYFATRLCSRPQAWSAEGINDSGGENSSLITGCDAARAAYLGELLGRYARQKWILVFNPRLDGKERLLIVTFAVERPMEAVKELRRFGIKMGTVVAQGTSARFYLWVKDHSLDASVGEFAAAQKGGIQEIAGEAAWIGNHDRGAAQKFFGQRIHAYERTHHVSLSRLLWSKRLRDLGLGRE